MPMNLDSRLQGKKLRVKCCIFSTQFSILSNSFMGYFFAVLTSLCVFNPSRVALNNL